MNKKTKQKQSLFVLPKQFKTSTMIIFTLSIRIHLSEYTLDQIHFFRDSP